MLSKVQSRVLILDPHSAIIPLWFSTKDGIEEEEYHFLRLRSVESIYSRFVSSFTNRGIEN